MAEGRTIMGYWDCNSCGTSGIRGDVRSCPNCSKPRDHSTRFYMKSKTDYIEKGPVKHNPDWACDYCGSLNPYTQIECKSCGSPKSDSKTNYFTAKQPTGSQAQPKVEPVQQEPLPDTGKWKKMGCALVVALGILAALVITVIALIIGALIPKSQTVSVQGFQWERSIDIEESTPVDESGWYVPSGAVIYDSREEFKEYISVIDHYETVSRQVSHQEIVGYETVVDGYTDNGDGTFTEQVSQEPIYETVYETEYYEEPVYRQEPVYATRYYYTVWRWSKCRTVQTSGENQEPYWGETNLRDSEREGNRSDVYRVITATGKQDSVIYTFDYDEWITLEKGQEIEIKVHRDQSAELKKK